MKRKVRFEVQDSINPDRLYYYEAHLMIKGKDATDVELTDLMELLMNKLSKGDRTIKIKEISNA